MRGSLASAGRPCILLRQLSPVRWSPPGGAGEMSPHHPQPPPTQAPPRPQAAPPASRFARKSPRLQAAPPASRPARKSPRLQADPTQAPLRPQIAPPASRPNQRSESPRTVGEQRHLTPANSIGPATFPSSQEGWPKAGVVPPPAPPGGGATDRAPTKAAPVIPFLPFSQPFYAKNETAI